MAESEYHGRGRGRVGFSRGRGVMKRPRPEAHEYEYDDFSGGKKRRINDDVYRFLVREDLVKRLIGKGGGHIKEIKDEAMKNDIETKVSVYAQCTNGTPLMDGAKDRVMSIQSTPDGLAMALTHLIYNLQIHKNHRGIRNFEESQEKKQKLELRLLVPSYSCSAIIGKGGAVVSKIKSETSSYIQVYTLPLPESEEHCVRIQNFKEDDLIQSAVKVFEAISEIKGKEPIIMYDPVYFEHGVYGDTGSYIDTEWYQDALRSGVAKPTSFREIRDGYTSQDTPSPRALKRALRGPRSGKRPLADPYASAADPYAADPYATDPYAADSYATDTYAEDPYATDTYAEDPYAEETAYEGTEYAYEDDYGYEESYYTPAAPRARARAAQLRGVMIRGRGVRGALRSRGAPSPRARGAPPMRARGTSAPRAIGVPLERVRGAYSARARGGPSPRGGLLPRGGPSARGGPPPRARGRPRTRPYPPRRSYAEDNLEY